MIARLGLCVGALGVLLSASICAIVSPALADCDLTGDLVGMHQKCVYSPDEVRTMYGSAATEGYRYRLSPACDLGGAAVCHEPAVCDEPPGSHRFDVLRSPDVDPPDWSVIGQTCLTDADAADLGALTPGMVLEAFRSLTWPAPGLVVQPPGGETLVNFETNFRTDLTEPVTQQVTLVGVQVTIEATPRSYVWHFGDGEADQTTSPGAAYPDLDVTHEYLRGDVTVRPSVDVVYAGRYRVGGSAWSDVPGTLTVPGPAEGLRVLEARPQLVG